jgi:ABC-2 type transport system permease protein
MLFSERTPWLVLVVLALSICYAVLNGLQWVAFQQDTIRTALDEESNRYATLKQQVQDIQSGKMRAPFADPRMPDAAGARLAWRYAAMPPLSLAPLSVGQSDVLPYYFKVTSASRESVLTTNEIENPHRLLHGRFDLSFVVIYVFPLLIIGLTYNLLSSEKEQGTLALLMSQPVRLRTFMAGKIGLRAGLVILIVIGLSLIGMAVGGVDMTSAAMLTRVLMWTAVVAAYGAFWFGVVLLVCALGRGSATNALGLAGIWLLLVIVLPSTLNTVVSTLYPMPSRVDMIAALRVASDDASAKGNQLLAKYYGDHPELAAVTDLEKAMTDVAITRLAIDDEIEERVRPVVDRYDIQLARQQALVDRFRLLSPAIVAQDGLNDVAGTGAARYRHFVSLVEEYHDEWRGVFASMIVGKARLTPAAYDTLPQFTYREEPLRAVVMRTAGAAGLLLLSGAMLGAVGTRRLRKYPIAN